MTQVDLEYELVRILRGLSEAARTQVLQFAKSLQATESDVRPDTGKPSGENSLMGSFRRFGIALTDEELSEARRELWANFPRDPTAPDATPP